MRRNTLLILAFTIAGSALVAVCAILLSIQQAREYRREMDARAAAGGVRATASHLEGSLERIAAHNTQTQALVEVLRQLAEAARDRGDQEDPRAEELEQLRAEVKALRELVERRHDASRTPSPEAPVATSRAGGSEPASDHDRSARVEAVEGAVWVLAAGRRDGLQEGQHLTLHRGGKPIGEARVLTVREDMTGAETLSLTPGLALEAGDEARWLVSPVPQAPPPASPELVEPTLPITGTEGSDAATGVPAAGKEYVPRGEAVRKRLGPPPPAPSSGAGADSQAP